MAPGASPDIIKMIMGIVAIIIVISLFGGC
jgi:hypothetical protein